MNGKKLERPLYLELSFEEALERLIQTRPEEVEPPQGRRKRFKEEHRSADKQPNSRD
jgi:hypothetical protein